MQNLDTFSHLELSGNGFQQYVFSLLDWKKTLIDLEGSAEKNIDKQRKFLFSFQMIVNPPKFSPYPILNGLMLEKKECLSVCLRLKFRLLFVCLFLQRIWKLSWKHRLET